MDAAQSGRLIIALELIGGWGKVQRYSIKSMSSKTLELFVCSNYYNAVGFTAVVVSRLRSRCRKRIAASEHKFRASVNSRNLPTPDCSHTHRQGSKLARSFEARFNEV